MNIKYWVLVAWMIFYVRVLVDSYGVIIPRSKRRTPFEISKFLIVMFGLSWIISFSDIEAKWRTGNIGFWRGGWFFLLLGFALQVLVLNSQNLTCNQHDMKALEDFFNALLESSDETKAQVELSIRRSSPNCCSWIGITCNSSSSLGLDELANYGRVVKLEIAQKGFMGKLPESLGNLDQLRALNLSHNFLRGSIPSTLLHLPYLEVLDLSSNGFSGLFPLSINLPSIRVFNISNNLLQGSVPVGICDNATKLEVIKMGANSFHGILPPGLGNCTSLEDLHLASNFLFGNLPDDLFHLPNLASLDLQNNRFSGQLNGNIGNLSNLVGLDISLNQFSGNIPDVFHRFRNLNDLSARANNFTGGIPLSLKNSPTIVSLRLSNNSLSGIIDLNCSAMSSLVSLDLGSNLFHGPVPANLPDCPRLKSLNLARINFRGRIPKTFKNFQTLSHLSLSKSSIHNLSDALSTLQHCQNLITLVLTTNFFKEEMPSDPNLQFLGLKVLVIVSCRLKGTIPQWLSKASNLQLLDLSWNHLQGEIPSFFAGFRSLFYLDLSNNSLTGQIPKELTELESLIFGNLSLYDTTQEFSFFKKQGVSSRALRYKQILSFPPSLLLANNFLTGSIPPEFGNLKKLHVLDFKSNSLSGTIPGSLSGMTSIEKLDLSCNNLSGEIPNSLSKLSFLSAFVVAYNDLSGEIPRGGQFETFPNSSFEGNPGLCGYLLGHPCQYKNEVPRVLLRVKKTPSNFEVGMAVGVGFGFVMGIIIGNYKYQDILSIYIAIISLSRQCKP